MIHVLATIEALPGKREAFLEKFRKLMPLVRAEPGCIEYGPAIDASSNIPAQAKVGENRVVIVEKWESVAALETHLKAKHMVDFRVAIKDLVQGLELQVLQPVLQ